MLVLREEEEWARGSCLVSSGGGAHDWVSAGSCSEEVS